jgi:hypothetical protein
MGDFEEELSEVQNFIADKEFTTKEMLILIGILQAQTYEQINKTINKFHR